MNLTQELLVIAWDCVEAHNAMSKERVRQSLKTLLHNELDKFFDPDELYPRSRLEIQSRSLAYELIVSIDEDDETEYDAPNVTWHINLKNGKCERG